MQFKYILYPTILIGIIVIYASKHVQNTKIEPSIAKHFNINAVNFDHVTTDNQLLEWLDTTQTALWQEISAVYPMTANQCQQLRNDPHSDYWASIQDMKKHYNSNQLISADTVQLIKDIMAEFNVDSTQVEMIPWNIEIPASSTDSIIFVNESMFKKLSPEGQQFIIGHELIHLIHHDHSTRYFIRNSTPYKPITDQKNNPLNKLIQFQELRADILSCMKGKEYTEGNAYFMQQQIDKFGDPYIITYPKYSVRMKVGKKISALLEKK